MIVHLAATAQVSFDWVATGTSDAGVYGYSCHMDQVGNAYLIGEFSDTMDVDPGPGVSILSATSPDVFLVKYDRNGALQWGVSIGSVVSDAGTEVWVDPDGNVYFTGVFVATMDADPGPGVFNLVSIDNNEIFVIKLNSDGEFLWAFSVGSPNFERGRAITGDPSGNIYLLAEIRGTCDFDPGPGVTNLTNFGSGDAEMVLAKYNGDGEFLWASRLGGSGNDTGRDVEYGTNGFVYVTGDFAGTADFDPSGSTFNLVSSGNVDGFFAKYSAATGSLAWARKIGGTGADVIYDLTMGDSSQVFISGKFAGTCDVDPSGSTWNLVTAGNDDAFIGRYDSTGLLKWAGRFGGTSVDRAQGIHADGQGHILCTGRFRNTVDFDMSLGVKNLVSAGSDDVFVAVYSIEGAFQWAGSFSGTSVEDALAIASSNKGSLVVGGFFIGDTDFDPDTSLALSSGSVFGSCYLTQLKMDFQDNASPDAICSGPLTFYIDDGGIVTLEVRDLDGGTTDDTYLDSLWLSRNTFNCTEVGIYDVTLYAMDWFGKIDSCMTSVTVEDSIAPITYCKSIQAYLDSVGIFVVDPMTVDSASLDNCGLDSLWTLPAQLTCGDTGWTPITLFVMDRSGNMGNCVTSIHIGDTLSEGRIPVNLPDDYQYCSAVQVTLEAPPGFASYLWNTGDTTSSLLVSGPGQYSVQVWNEYGCSGADTVEVFGRLLADSVLEAAPPFSLCLNDTLLLLAQAGFTTYVWSDGTMGASLTAVAGGGYTITVTDSLGCEYFDSTHVDYYAVPLPAPVISPEGNVGICDGVPVGLDAGSGYASYLWNVGASTQTISVDSGGIYSVMVTNGFGCRAFSEEVLVVETAAPAVSFLYGGAGDTLFAYPAGAGYTYQWWVSGAYIPGATQSWYIPIWSGIYKVQVTSPEGCVADGDTVISVIGMEEPLFDGELVVYPNPTSGAFEIDWTADGQQYDRIQVMDQLGREVRSIALQPGVDRQNMDLGDAGEGLYWVVLHGNQGSKVAPLVVH